GIQFVDIGSVRRRPLPDPPSQSWLLAPAGGYPAVDEAISLQFQEQIADLTRPTVAQSQLAATRAVDFFRYLPAAGMIPVAGTGAQRGFAYPTFFDRLIHRDPAYVEGALVEQLLRDSLAYPPIDLQSGDLVWIYQVRENRQTIDTRPSSAPQAYLIF